MNATQEQLVALGGVFLAAVLVDKIAKTGQVSEADLSCMLGSLLVRDPKDTLEVFGGDDINLREGYRALIGALERDPNTLQREPLRYALSMLGLERQLAKRDALPAEVVREIRTQALPQRGTPQSPGNRRAGAAGSCLARRGGAHPASCTCVA